MSLICSELQVSGRSVGLVPTMGALHDGHLSLVSKSLAMNDVTVVSIFVNPLQFDKEEDLNNYPSDMQSDLSKLEAAGVDFVFKPLAADFYKAKPVVSISFGEMEQVLEGEFRPGHFGGVGVVVSKLFHIIPSNHAYFGLKDLQQFLLIKRMVEDLGFPVEVIGVETKREGSGLAMSSRNLRLSTEGKEIASMIHRGLKLAEEFVLKGKPFDEIEQEVGKFYEEVGALDIEYLAFVDGHTLTPVDSYDGLSELAVCFAGYVEGVRLIDNLYLRLK